MSSIYGKEHLVRARPAAHEAARLFHGKSAPKQGEIPAQEDPKFLEERASISAVLVAKAVDAVVIGDDSILGYRFKDDLPTDITTEEALQEWVKKTCHEALDQAIEEDPHVAAIAKRYGALLHPDLPPGQTLVTVDPVKDRREALQFEGSVHDPFSWLKMGNVAAKFKGLEIRPDQAFAFILSQLPEMQQSARRDVALQFIRTAIVDSVSALGEMRSRESKADTEARYGLLRWYVGEKTGHQFAATRFGNLYSVEPDAEIGVRFLERKEGFGPIAPFREISFACPAGYRLTDPDEGLSGGENGQSALFRLLRASTNALNSQGLFHEALDLGYHDTATAERILRASLPKEPKILVVGDPFSTKP